LDVKLCSRRPRRAGNRQYIAFDIVRFAAVAEQKTCSVLFRHSLDVLDEPGCLANANYQHARGERIERTGMADARLVQAPPRDSDDVVRGKTPWLVDDEDAVHQTILSMRLTIDDG
jgi:hypothetical protein